MQIATPDFVGHPKIIKLVQVIEEHFLTHESPQTTRVMVFSHFRDSVDEIVAHMRRVSSMIKPMGFIGQVRTNAMMGLYACTWTAAAHGGDSPDVTRTHVARRADEAERA